jgi:hypothetical protein
MIIVASVTGRLLRRCTVALGNVLSYRQTERDDSRLRWTEKIEGEIWLSCIIESSPQVLGVNLCTHGSIFGGT